MQIASYRFAPPWWGVLLTIVVIVILCALGAWQIQRAHYKERLVAAHDTASAAGPQIMRLNPAQIHAHPEVAHLRYGYHYIATGHYDEAHQILLADQVEGTRTGYDVWTPLVLASGAQVMVDRGWVPRLDDKGMSRPNPPAPVGRVTIRGYWKDFPQPGLRFGDSKRCDLQGWPRVLSFPRTAGVRCQYSTAVANGLLLLNSHAAGGFVRDWDEDAIGLSPWMHYFYASQWFLMALAALIILGVVNIRRMPGST